MFDWKLAAIILVAGIPGIAIGVPRSLKRLTATAASRLPEGKTLPPRPVLIAVQILQSVVLVAGLSVVGVVCAKRAGFSAPFFAALAGRGNVAASLPDALPVVGLSVAGTVVFLVLYYVLLRPWMDRDTAAHMDGLRNEMGLASRILYGGIVEEIIMRWGVMSLLGWLAGMVAGPVAAAWIAIVVSGILFGLGHIPGYTAGGCEKTPALITTMIVLNLWAGLIFGYLFWQHGLLAAMVSHMIFHLVWFPVDVATSRRTAGATA